MIEFELPGLSCGHCAATVTEAVSHVDPNARLDIDMQHKRVSIDSDEDREAFVEALRAAGYAPAP